MRSLNPSRTCGHCVKISDTIPARTAIFVTYLAKTRKNFRQDSTDRFSNGVAASGGKRGGGAEHLRLVVHRSGAAITSLDVVLPGFGLNFIFPSLRPPR